jgi:transposase
MRRLYWLTDGQSDRLRPFFPKSRDKPRVDDWRVSSGTIFIQRNGLKWKHAPATHGPPKTLYVRLMRWSRIGQFTTIMTELAAEAQKTGTVMIDAAHATRARSRRCRDVPWSFV